MQFKIFGKMINQTKFSEGRYFCTFRHLDLRITIYELRFLKPQRFKLATVMASRSLPSLFKTFISDNNEGFISKIISRKKIDSSNSSSTILSLFTKSG